MRRKKVPQKETPAEPQVRDFFRTPREAVLDIIPFIPTKKVWEAANGEGYIKMVLEEHGFEVVGSDIRLPETNFICNFLYDEPPEPVQQWIKKGELFSIVTNPPYSIKKKFVYKCVNFNVPFALLLQSDYTQWIIDFILDYNCEKIIPYRRYNFITPYHKESQAQFHSMWLTRFFNLGKTEYFLDRKEKSK